MRSSTRTISTLGSASAIHDKLRGSHGSVAYIEAYTTEDSMIGDREDWVERSAADCRRVFCRAGLTLCGPQCYTTPTPSENHCRSIMHRLTAKLKEGRAWDTPPTS